MRTTIRLNPSLLAKAKALAHRSGRTLTAVVEDALRESLGRREKPGRRERVRLTTAGGRGARPGVDLDDSARLRDLMDGPRATR